MPDKEPEDRAKLRAEILRLHSLGYNQREIGEILGYCRSNICLLLKEAKQNAQV